MSKLLSQGQLDSYRETGYLLIKDGVPDAVMDTAQTLNEAWSDKLIEDWFAEGLLPLAERKAIENMAFRTRFLNAWETAGRPQYRRSPFRHLMLEETYDLLSNPDLLVLAEDLLGTTEINVHGIFNGLVSFPDAPSGVTPWHQDSQFWDSWDTVEPDQARETHVVTFWFPLHHVDATNGCLQVMSLQETGRKAFDLYEAKLFGFDYIGMPPEDVERLTAHVVEMERGDLLAFSQLTPHAALPNNSNQLRWSFDLRYEASKTATVIGKKYGFTVQSKVDPSSVTPCEEWLKRRWD